MAEREATRALVRGHVQGVGYRDFACNKATALGLTGYVRNLPNRRLVEVVAEGAPADLDRLLDLLRRGPPAAVVEAIDQSRSPASGRYHSFTIEAG
jgi:acylphosphatase